MLKTYTFTMLKNVCYCLVLHLLKNGPISFAIDHSPFARMTVTLAKGSILWRCQSPYHHRWQTCLCAGWTVAHPRVSPFLLPAFHQISTLEKTNSCQQSLPVLWRCSFHELRGIWLSDLVFPRLSDAVEASTFGSLVLYRETKFISGFDFAVTLSSPASSCVLFDITSRRSVELKWLMLNKHKRWFHSSRVKFPLVKMSAS